MCLSNLTRKIIRDTVHELFRLATTVILFDSRIDCSEWVKSIDTHLELAECLKAFVSGFGRIQHHCGQAHATQADTSGGNSRKPDRNLQSAEGLGIIENVNLWLEARKRLNKLVREYMKSSDASSEDLMLGKEHALML
jgi:hypothetical protein